MARVHGAEMKRRSSHELSGLATDAPHCLLPFIIRGECVGLARNRCEAFSSSSISCYVPAMRAECSAAVLAGGCLVTFLRDTFAF